jgi:hypothetical protein
MLAVAAVAVAAALAPAYGGRTDEGRRIVVEVERGRVVLVHAAIDSYVCATFGEVGPLRVHARANARVDGKGRFSLRVGERAETVIASGTVTARNASGSLRVRGTIATGQKCQSHTLHFSARPR